MPFMDPLAGLRRFRTRQAEQMKSSDGSAFALENLVP
jgi:hypothetical protein